jgi:hypothetical protein
MKMCIEESTEEYLWIMGDDDLLEKKCLQNLILAVKNARDNHAFLLNFKQVDRDGFTVIKQKISNVSANWSGFFTLSSELGSGVRRGIFDMFFFIGSVVIRREILELSSEDFDCTTDWEHMPVLLRSLIGKKIYVISEENIVQRQRNHRKDSQNPKLNSYNAKNISGIRRLIEKLEPIYKINNDARLIFEMKAPFILHEPVYYRFINFKLLVCHPGTIDQIEKRQDFNLIKNDIDFLLRNLPIDRDRVSVLNYFRNIEEFKMIVELKSKKVESLFEQLRLGNEKFNSPDF